MTKTKVVTISSELEAVIRQKIESLNNPTMPTTLLDLRDAIVRIDQLRWVLNVSGAEG